MYAIVATGGKQLKVAAGDVVAVEKLPAAVGEHVAFDVLLLADGDQIVVDPAGLASAKVTGEVVEHFKGEKAVIFKFKKRKGYKRLKGHRQQLTRVKITDVASAEAPPKKKAAPRKKTDKPTEKPAEVVEMAPEAAENE
jgi:large subunit ribosomal protein L21